MGIANILEATAGSKGFALSGLVIVIFRAGSIPENLGIGCFLCHKA